MIPLPTLAGALAVGIALWAAAIWFVVTGVSNISYLY